MLSILIVEDDPNFRARFAEFVESCVDFELLAAVGTCAEARACLAKGKPDVLLCDLGLPDGDGADIVREACGAFSGLDAMMVTVFGDEAHVMRSLEAGANTLGMGGICRRIAGWPIYKRGVGCGFPQLSVFWN